MYEGTVLNLEFEDTTWMDNINKVIVNDKECKKSTINSFSSDTNIWEVGSATGAYGSYKALKLAVPDGKLWTVKVSADGYKDLTVKITKETVNYTDTYKAEVVSNSGETTNKTYTADVTPAVNGKITVTGIGNYEGSTGKAVFTISKNNSASTDPTNPSNPNGDKKVTDKKVSNNTNNVKPVVKNVAAKNNKNVPKTGDNANVLLWIALAVISCGVLAGAGVAVRKRK